MRFRLLAPPAVEPVTVADLLAFARIDADPGDGVVQRLLPAARQRVERDTGLALINQTWVAVLDCWPAVPPPDFAARFAGGWELGGSGGGWPSGLREGAAALLAPPGTIEIARRPFGSLVSFQVRDAAGAFGAVDPATYWVETAGGTGRIVRRPGALWPPVPFGLDDAIELTVVLGFGAAPACVPADLQVAILMLAAHWHEVREPVIDGRFGAAPEHVRSILASWQGRRLR